MQSRRVAEAGMTVRARKRPKQIADSMVEKKRMEVSGRCREIWPQEKSVSTWNERGLCVTVTCEVADEINSSRVGSANTEVCWFGSAVTEPKLDTRLFISAQRFH